MIRSFSQKLRAFREDRSGAAMLEFAISLPILLLILAVVIEGSRIAWTHQAAASGVRDASRFLARITQADICSNAGSLATFTDDFRDEATDIVAERVGSPDEQILPGGVNVVAITPSNPPGVEHW